MKTLEELKESIRSRIGRNYSSDMKLIPTGKPGETSERTDRKTGGSIPAGYRMVRARAVTWDRAPSYIGISAPKVGDSPSEFDRATKVHDKFEDDINRLYRNLKHGKGSDKDQKKTKKEQAKVKEDVDVLDEAKKAQVADPPFVLILKRQVIKTYPNNIKVALYYSDKLNKYISIPYGPNIDSNIQVEEVDERTLVSSIINIFYNLSEENKIKMIDMINKDADSYSKVREFILENGFDKTTN